MFILYTRKWCPFCEDVVRAGKELGVELEMLDVGDAVVRSELIMRGGKAQVPYLVDTDRKVEMYESADIIKHLRSVQSK